ncbi:MAG: SGNH/GDSL hydrolase family protein [Dehalococcoidia bacterium]|nr:SGNH/GDSL hydrolase family protein [Dehalococcoidia bacterium]
MRYLALGDSYTIGEGVEASERWPAQLAAMLRERGAGAGEPEVLAQTGWTTDELDAAIDAAAPRGPFELVSLLIGVNNQYRGRPVEEYREEFRTLLQRTITFAGGDARRVFVMSIPDWGVTPFAEGRDRKRIAAEIDAFNLVARDEAKAAGVAYIEVTAFTREIGGDESYLVADRLHYSGKAYRVFAEAALPTALAALRTE